METRPDPAAARSAPASVLRRQLGSAPGVYLEVAVDNPALHREEMLLLLRNRRAPSGLLERIGRDPRWIRHPEIKRALVLHRATPRTLARNLIPHLFWRDLADVAASPAVDPVLRRSSEKVLEIRMDEMTVGERIALARIASRAIVRCLIKSADARVLAGVLGNPRLIEQDAVAIASTRSISPALLTELAGHWKWGSRRAVRLAITSNRRTPVAVALRLAATLDLSDLRGLARDDRVPRIVRIGAERRIRSSGGAPGPVRSGGA
jgi:hypothetical protein